MRRILILSVLLFYFPAYAQTPPASALFIAEAGMLDFEFDGAYIIALGTNAGIQNLKSPAPLFALYDETRPLEDNLIGMANVHRIESHRTIITPFFKTGSSPRIGERILVDLPIRLPNPYYRSMTHLLASNALTMMDIAGNILLDFDSFEDDGLYIEFIILSVFQDDLVKTALEMRGQMDNIEIKGGRYNGKRLFDTMTAVTLDDLEDFIGFMNAYPGNYMGYGHVFSEMFALWAVNGAQAAMPAGDANPSLASLGFTLVDDPDAEYPMVGRVSQAYYGRKGNIIVPGSHILFIGEQSMRQRKASDLDGLLEGEKYQLVSLSVQTLDKKVFDIEMPRLPLPDNPGWEDR